MTQTSCNVCHNTDHRPLDFGFRFLRNRSRFPSLHTFSNILCERCGNVQTFPEISDEKLTQFYNNDYRQSDYAVFTDQGRLEPPIQIPWSGMSFRRFQTVYDTFQKRLKRPLETVLTEQSSVIDIGGYQGMMLHALTSVAPCNAMVVDYSHDGVEFAKHAFGFTGSYVPTAIEDIDHQSAVDMVTMIHSFEHIRDPNRFLENLRARVLRPDGLLYIEIPNPGGHPLDDPTHLNMYTQRTLRFVLEKNGFEVETSFTTGFGCEHFIFHSDVQNIVCVARATEALKPDAKLPEGSPDQWAKELELSQASTNRKAYVNALVRMLEPFAKALKRTIQAK